jgi:hypothetical protein
MSEPLWRRLPGNPGWFEIVGEERHGRFSARQLQELERVMPPFLGYRRVALVDLEGGGHDGIPVRALREDGHSDRFMLQLREG